MQAAPRQEATHPRARAGRARPLVEQHAADCARGDTRLFPHDRLWVLSQVYRLCTAAGVPKACAHGLRGSHATLAMVRGETAEAVAKQLGHEGPAVTRRHHIAEWTQDVSRIARVAEQRERRDPAQLDASFIRELRRMRDTFDRVLRCLKGTGAESSGIPDPGSVPDALADGDSGD